MTLTEQGQRWTIKADGPDGRVDHFYADTDLMELEVVPASELEMCQRYFPFAQRSRAHYKRRCEEAEHNLAELRKLWEPLGKRAEAAETARDEAVKREKATREWANQRTREEADHADRQTKKLQEAQEREKALREALQEIADTNGWEFANVLADKARAALDQSGKEARS